MGRLVTTVLGAALLMGGGPVAAHASEKLTERGVATFPLRSYVLTPDRPLAIDVGRARVTENGRPVRDVRLESVGARSASSAVILVIDASESMAGAPIERAMDAARALAARRSSQQRLGVVLFNAQPRTLLSPTTDATQITAALSKVPELEGGTRIFDAGGTALDVLRSARVNTGSLVVLSDGNDTGSATSLAMLGERARRSGVRIFTVGLRSKRYEGESLRALAVAGRGDYREAESAAGLRTIFEGIGTRLASEYVLTYRSPAAPRTRVDVMLRAPGLPGGATARYVTPAGATVAIASPDDGFWAQDAAIAATSLGTGLLIGLSALFFLGHRRRQRRDLGTRIAAFGMPVPERYEPQSERRERSTVLERFGWWDSFREEADIAQLERTPERLFAMGAVGGFLLSVLAASSAGTPALLLMAAGGPLVVRAIVGLYADRQRRAFDEQLVDTLQGSASALRAGHSITSALTEVVGAAAEPTRRELGGALSDERLGKPLDDALRDVSRRMGNRDVEQIALVSKLQRTTGANMAEVLDRVAETVRARQDINRTIRALTAQGRMARIVLTALPAVFLLIVAVLNPDYIRPLFTESTGIVLLVVAAVSTATGSFAIKKIVEIEV